MKCALHVILLLTLLNLTESAMADMKKSSTADYTDSFTGMKFVWVPGGCYSMGDTFGDGSKDEKPVREVCLDGYYLGKYEVTQRQWEKVTGNNPSDFDMCGGECPVEEVSWNDIQEYISKLNQQSGLRYRLPTEAEWEYAARSGGKNERWSGTNNVKKLAGYAWYDKNSGNKTHPVGQKKPNGLGLYDMTGNVEELVSDWYDKYPNSNESNPQGASTGPYRVYRGGDWGCDVKGLSVSGRAKFSPSARINHIGFRLAFSANKNSENFAVMGNTGSSKAVKEENKLSQPPDWLKGGWAEYDYIRMCYKTKSNWTSAGMTWFGPGYAEKIIYNNETSQFYPAGKFKHKVNYRVIDNNTVRVYAVNKMEDATPDGVNNVGEDLWTIVKNGDNIKILLSGKEGSNWGHLEPCSFEQFSKTWSGSTLSAAPISAEAQKAMAELDRILGPKSSSNNSNNSRNSGVSSMFVSVEAGGSNWPAGVIEEYNLSTSDSSIGISRSTTTSKSVSSYSGKSLAGSYNYSISVGRGSSAKSCGGTVNIPATKERYYINVDANCSAWVY